METRADYMLVGIFTVCIVVGAFMFVLWAAKNDKGETVPYKIVFEQSVSGLSVGSAVFLEGVRIGQVTHIKVSPNDPGKVLVRIVVAEDAPIRQNSIATLEPQGVTGVSVVAVTGGTKESPKLTTSPGSIGHIVSRASKLQEIMNSVPSILASIDRLVGRVDHLLSNENADKFGTIIGSLAEVSETLAKNKDSLSQGIAALGQGGASFVKSAKKFERFLDNANILVTKDFHSAASSVNDAAGKLGSLVEGMEPGLLKASRESVGEMHRLLIETRILMTYLSRLSQKMESDPRRFLFGNPIPEFSAP